MDKLLFEGRRHRITTDGKSRFFLYMKLENGGLKLIDENSFSAEIYQEALSDMKDVMMMEMTEDEIISRLSETGFFKV